MINIEQFLKSHNIREIVDNSQGGKMIIFENGEALFIHGDQLFAVDKENVDKLFQEIDNA